jgi:hypothetical protein
MPRIGAQLRTERTRPASPKSEKLKLVISSEKRWRETISNGAWRIGGTVPVMDGPLPLQLASPRENTYAVSSFVRNTVNIAAGINPNIGLRGTMAPSKVLGEAALRAGAAAARQFAQKEYHRPFLPRSWARRATSVGTPASSWARSRSIGSRASPT